MKGFTAEERDDMGSQLTTLTGGGGLHRTPHSLADKGLVSPRRLTRLISEKREARRERELWRKVVFAPCWLGSRDNVLATSTLIPGTLVRS